MTNGQRRGLCYVCQNWSVELVCAGAGKLRHDYCAPGSDNWVAWYRQHPEHHNAAGDILVAFAEREER